MRDSVRDDLRVQFEAANRLNGEERKILKALIEGMLLQHEASRWAASG